MNIVYSILAYYIVLRFLGKCPGDGPPDTFEYNVLFNAFLLESVLPCFRNIDIHIHIYIYIHIFFSKLCFFFKYFIAFSKPPGISSARLWAALWALCGHAGVRHVGVPRP